MVEFEDCVQWVGPCEDSSYSDHALDKDGVIDVLEWMNADALALLETRIPEPGN